MAASVMLRILPQSLEVKIKCLISLILAPADHNFLGFVSALKSLEHASARLCLVTFTEPVLCTLEYILANLRRVRSLKIKYDIDSQI